MSCKKQVNVLADYIMREIPGEPNQSQGAGETAVRILTQYRNAFQKIMDELGVPDNNYPTSIANAFAIAKSALGL